MDQESKRLQEFAPPEPTSDETISLRCTCGRCNELMDRLEKLSYCLAVARQIADVRCPA